MPNYSALLTPLFENNATGIDGTQASLKTIENILQKQLHAYAIEDRNVLRFHIDYVGEKPKR